MMRQKENVFIIKKERKMAKLSRLSACVVVTKLMMDGHKLIWNIVLFSKTLTGTAITVKQKFLIKCERVKSILSIWLEKP